MPSTALALIEPKFKVGDWVIHEMEIGQVTEIRTNGCATFSDGYSSSYGKIAADFRPLTLRNKTIAEAFHSYYKELYQIDGSNGFNFPVIKWYFNQLAISTMDGSEGNERKCYEQAAAFVKQAKAHRKTIQGISLFRPTVKKGRA